MAELIMGPLVHIPCSQSIPARFHSSLSQYRIIGNRGIYHSKIVRSHRITKGTYMWFKFREFVLDNIPDNIIIDCKVSMND